MRDIVFTREPPPAGVDAVPPYEQPTDFVARALGDGHRVVSVTARSIRVWCRRTGELLETVVPSSNLPMNTWCGIAITLAGTVLLLHDGELHELSLETLALTRRLDNLAPGQVRLFLSPTDERLAIFGSRGPLSMYGNQTGTLSKLWEWPRASGSCFTFSSDSTLLLWEEDIPQQTGSDLTGYGVCDSRNGEVLVAEQCTCYREVAYFSEDETHVLFGNRGDQPPKQSTPICRDGARIKAPSVRGDHPLHASHHRTFAPFRAELRERQEPAEGG